MKILYLCPSPHLGLGDRAGWSSHMDGVIGALRGQGHAVRPYLAGDGARRGVRGAGGDKTAHPWRRFVPLKIRAARRDTREWLHDRGLDRRVIAVCREFCPEALYERTEVLHGVGSRLARRLGVPHVVEVNGPLVEERDAWAGMLMAGRARRLEVAKYAAADAIVTVSAALGRYLVAQGVDPEKIHAIPNGVDLQRFDPQRAHPAAVRQQIGCGRRLVVGFVGAFADWHGLEALVTAMGEVARSRVLDVHLLMVGEGPSRTSLRRLAHQVGLEGRAAMPGSVPHDQVPHYLAAMDICVLPRANWYMSPIKLFEYGAMGRAVVAPRTPAVEEVMTDGEDGLLVEPGCPESLARAIAWLAARPEKRVEMASTFRRRVREQYTWATVAGRVSQLLEQCVRERQLRAQGSGLRVSGYEPAHPEL